MHSQDKGAVERALVVDSALQPTWRGSPRADCGKNRLVGFAGELSAFCRPARPRARPVSRAAANAAAWPHLYQECGRLFCGFSYKNFAGTRPIARLRGVLLQTPCRGTRCACFRDCARVFRGGCLCVFLRGSVFRRFVLRIFWQTGLESVPTLQGG